MTRKMAVLLVVCVLFVLSSAAMAYNQNPNLNYGNTNIIDAMLPPPGVYMSNYMIVYTADEFKDGKGDSFPMNNELDLVVYAPQFIWVSKKELPHGLRWGAQALWPMFGFDVHSDLGIDSGGGILGDPCVGPFIGSAIPLGTDFVFHWFFEFDVYFPIGAYDKNKAVNPSANYWTFEPWVTMTLQMPYGFTFSTRQHLTFNTKNDEYVNPGITGDLNDHDLEAGDLWHFNYALMKTVDFISPNLRFGVAGYYGQQFDEDKVDGIELQDSEEKVFAIGPALHYIHKGMIFSLKTYFESEVENRPEGEKIVFRVIIPF